MTRCWIVALVVVSACAGPEGPEGPRGAQGSPGEKGDPGDEGDPGPGVPSISAVSPVTIYLEHPVRVTVSGSNTEWDGDVSLEFGPGITVDNVEVASPSAIVADIVAAPDAALGPRDVSATNGEATWTFARALEVEAPLSHELTSGNAVQGGVVIGVVGQRDADAPFSTVFDGAFTTADVAAGSSTTIAALSPYEMSYLAFIDVFATPGPSDVVVQSGQVGEDPLSSRAVGALDVIARAPVDVTVGTPLTGSLDGADLETTLLAVSVPPGNVVTYAFDEPNTSIGAYLLPPSGRFDDSALDSLPSGVIPAGPGGTYYLVALNTLSGAADFELNTATVPTDESEPNNDCDGAQSLEALPVSLTGLTLNFGDDEDWFIVDVPDNRIGDTLDITTSGPLGAGGADTFIDVFASDCVTPLGSSTDANFYDTLISDTLTSAGPVYVRVTNSPAFGFAGPSYDLSIDFRLGPTPETEPNGTSTEAFANNAFALAEPILGAGAISPPGDIDIWAVTLAAMADLSLTVEQGSTDQCGPAGAIDTFLTLYGADGTTVLGSNEDINATDNHCSAVTVPGLAAGTYYVEITASAAFCAGCTFDYAVRIETP